MCKENIYSINSQINLINTVKIQISTNSKENDHYEKVGRVNKCDVACARLCAHTIRIGNT